MQSCTSYCVYIPYFTNSSFLNMYVCVLANREGVNLVSRVRTYKYCTCTLLVCFGLMYITLNPNMLYTPVICTYQCYIYCLSILPPGCLPVVLHNQDCYRLALDLLPTCSLCEMCAKCVSSTVFPSPASKLLYSFRIRLKQRLTSAR